MPVPQPIDLPGGVEVEAEDDGALIRIPEKILFDFDSSKLRSEAYPVLEKIAESLKEDGGKEFKVLIKGHTDSKGSDATTWCPSAGRRR